MIPLQTEVDGALDASIAAGELLITRYWWAAVLFVFAYYLRWYGVTQEQGHSTPELTAAYATAKHAGYTTLTSISIVIGVVAAVFAELAWGFQIGPSLVAGIVTFDAVIWSSVVSVFLGFSTGLSELGYRSYSPQNVAWIVAITFLGMTGLRLVYTQAVAAGDDDSSSDGGD